MIRKLTSFALDQPLFVFLLTGLFIAAGVVAFRNLPIEAFPDVTDIQVTVITLYPGLRGRRSGKAGHDAAGDRPGRTAELRAHVLAHAIRAFLPDHHLRRQSHRLRCAPTGARTAARRRSAGQSRRATGAAQHAHRRAVSLSAARRPGLRSHRAALDRGLGGGAAVAPGAGRGRRGDAGRIPEAVPGQSRPGEAQVLQRLDAASADGAGAGQCQRRRQLHRTGRAAIPGPRHRPAALGGRHRQHPGERKERHAAVHPRSGRRHGECGSAAGNLGPRRPGRDRKRHRRHAQGRESVGGAGRDQAARADAERADPAQGRQDRSFL